MTRVTLGGPELEGFTVDEPASSVRLLLPSPDSADLVMPDWNGNEFLLPDGGRPAIRTFTPLRVDPQSRTFDLEIVVHGSGVASSWAEGAEPGATAAVSGPGRGYTLDPVASAFLLAGDETAIPAIGQLLEVLPPARPVRVLVEIARPDARLELPEHPRASVEWHELEAGSPPGEALVSAMRAAEVPDGARLWVAGEAAAVQRIRRHLFQERGLSRLDATVRGYWKHGRSGEDGNDG
jgi:NADPH-dependent ferric siderophore reductase